MARICEVCGRIEEKTEDHEEHDLLDVCTACTSDRHLLRGIDIESEN